MDFDKIKLTDIIPSKYNPRSISDDELIKLGNSIGEFGLVDPIIINLNNNKIIGGHQRYEVLLNQHMENNSYGELNLIRLGDVGWVFTGDDLKIKSEEHEKALNIALNKISGEWDTEKLNDLLDDLSVEGFDVSLTGFDYKSSYDFDEEDFNFKEGEDGITKYQDKRSGGTEISEDLKIKNIIFKIKIKCDDEKHQEELYELLKSEGYDCQILTL